MKMAKRRKFRKHDEEEYNYVPYKSPFGVCALNLCYVFGDTTPTVHLDSLYVLVWLWIGWALKSRMAAIDYDHKYDREVIFASACIPDIDDDGDAGENEVRTHLQ